MSDCLLGTKQISSLWLPERHLGSSFESAMGWIVSNKQPSSNYRRKKKDWTVCGLGERTQQGMDNKSKRQGDEREQAEMAR